ncbi:hypothetical protein P43SY_002680 [Pythium insidiosum]|uniref:HMG box domain-containing protein n=1 Tax=Pythium insidiosum TaxID=114742 RepID=A0AAD5QDD4_PYTIN|nr:hypothetical protein P43SY_002680 [Pythium insidiosum]
MSHVADRLARLLESRALSSEQVAAQLGWPHEELQRFVAPENRQSMIAVRWSPSPEMESAVEKLLVRHQLETAAAHVKRSLRRVTVASSSATLRHAHSMAHHDNRTLEWSATGGSSHRKRKRKTFVKPLPEFTRPRRPATSVDTLCPVRIDVDVDGVHFQDTLLINSADSTATAESIAAQIARDERLTDSVQETKGPRPINPFIMYCQIQKDVFMKSKLRRSAAESRKIMGDMWRKMTDEEKEHYAKLTEVENEKRRREHVFDMRDRAIAEWEEDEARRLGMIGSSSYETTTEHVRGVLLANYINERHEVDMNRPTQDIEAEADDENGEHEEDEDDQ